MKRIAVVVVAMLSLCALPVGAQTFDPAPGVPIKKDASGEARASAARVEAVRANRKATVQLASDQPADTGAKVRQRTPVRPPVDQQ